MTSTNQAGNHTRPDRLARLARLHESDRFIVVDKPEGWLSVPSRMGQGDGRPCVGIVLQEELGRRIFPCHRLDEPVSGVLLFALDADAHRAAGAWFERGDVRKTYEALTALAPLPTREGDPLGPRPGELPGEGEWMEWRARLAKGKRRAYEHPVAGKESITRAKYAPGEANPDRNSGAGNKSAGYRRWHLQPLTGRPHQLRFEIARRGFPIVGDALYGSPLEWQGGGIALRAFCLEFGACPGAAALGLPAEVVAAPITFPGGREAARASKRSPAGEA